MADNRMSFMTAEEAAHKMGGMINADRIKDLAEAGYAPHHRIDNDGPFFKITELKTWVKENLVTEHPGRTLPTQLRIVNYGGKDPIVGSLPVALRSMSDLRDISDIVNLSSGIYFLCQAGEVVYVGKSSEVGGRISHHSVDSRKAFDAAYYLPWPVDRIDSLEAALIRYLKPRLNRSLNINGAKGDLDRRAGLDFLHSEGLYSTDDESISDLAYRQ